MSNKYNSGDASLTLGGSLLQAENFLLNLLVNANTLAKLEALEQTLDWMDGKLAGYREKMSVAFYCPFDNKTYSYTNYYEAIKLIRQRIEQYKGRSDIKEERVKLVFWINRWSELLTSCYDYLHLLPERSAGEAKWEEYEKEPSGGDDIELHDSETWTEETKTSYD